jgi:hypothetical protein
MSQGFAGSGLRVTTGGVAISAGTLAQSTGTVEFAAANNVTFGMNASGQVTASAGAAGGGVAVSAGTVLQSTGTISFANSNGLAFGLNAGTLTGSYSVPTQTVQPAVNLAAGTQTATSGTVAFVNSNGLTFGMSGSNQITGSYTVPTQSTAPAALAVNAAGSVTAGTAVLSNSNNITFGIDVSTITASASFPAQTVQPAVNLAAGSQTATSGTVAFVASNGIAFGMSGSNQITASYTVPTQSVQPSIGSISVGGNTAGSTSAGSGTVVLAGGNNITLSGATAAGAMTLSVVAAAAGGGDTISALDPLPFGNLVSNSILGQNSLYFFPFEVPAALSAYRINFFVSVAAAVVASNSTGSHGQTLSAALYAREAAQTNRITSFWSASAFIRANFSSNTNISVTHPVGISNSSAVSTSQYGVNATNASTYLASSLAGFRMIPMPISSTITPGQYWLAFARSGTSTNAHTMSLSFLQYQATNILAFAPFGTSSSASNAGLYGIRAVGTYGTTSGAFPGSVTVTQIRPTPAATVPYFNFSAYTTAVTGL